MLPLPCSSLPLDALALLERYASTWNRHTQQEPTAANFALCWRLACRLGWFSPARASSITMISLTVRRVLIKSTRQSQVCFAHRKLPTSPERFCALDRNTSDESSPAAPPWSPFEHKRVKSKNKRDGFMLRRYRRGKTSFKDRLRQAALERNRLAETARDGSAMTQARTAGEEILC
jgi:hypothetical protein